MNKYLILIQPTNHSFKEVFKAENEVLAKEKASVEYNVELYKCKVIKQL